MPTRYLKPGVRDSEAIDALTPLAETLFYRLLVTVDDFGRYDGRPAMVKAHCFPIKDMSVDTCAELLQELHANGLIVLYTAGGKTFLQMSKWENVPRATKSKYPNLNDESAQVHTDARNPPASVPLTVTVTGTETKTETETEGNAPRTRSAESPTDGQQEESEDPDEPTFISIPLVGKKLHPVTESKVAFYRENFPAVNVEQELRKMVAWCDANPDRRKTKRGIAAFIANWLSKVQDGAGKAPHRSQYQIDKEATARAIYGRSYGQQANVIDIGDFNAENTTPRLG